MKLNSIDRSMVKITMAAFLLAVITMTITFVVARTYNIPFKKITGDPALTFQANPLIGIVSNIGVLFWCATAAVCLFSGLFLHVTDHKKDGLFLICSGLITGILLVDDLFMLHDYIFYALGLNQYVMYTLYAILFSFYFLYFKRQILLSDHVIILIISFLFLGSSVGLDVLSKNEGIQYFFEDGLKFFGIIGWFLFFTATSFYTLRRKYTTIH